MKLEHYRYSLSSRDRLPLNARSSRSDFGGALIRLDGVGVACIHPWPELGDATLENELAALGSASPLRLGRCALACAELDGAARRDGRSLFAGLEIPPSHWTAGAADDPRVVAGDGFRVVKLKLGADIDAALRTVEGWSNIAGIERLRLDFNESLSSAGFISFWRQLGRASCEKIEFIEDPFPFSRDHWQALEEATGAAFALDRGCPERIGEWPGLTVIKAAKTLPVEMDKLLNNRDLPVVFTSYMDHAIGQLWAAWMAATYAGDRAIEAGLLSHERFVTDPFFGALRRKGPKLQAPDGTGLGLDDLLEALPWKPLN